jgi:hypothetical protein
MKGSAVSSRRKVKDDKALNLSELARVSGYDRGSLAGMMLPLTAGKIFYTDFRRILHGRQDAHESSLAIFGSPPGQHEIRALPPPPVNEAPDAAQSMKQSLADRFYFSS